MKKTLSVILSVLMVLSVFSVAVFAAPSDLTVTGETYFYLPKGYSLEKSRFSATLITDSSRVVDLANTLSPEDCIVSAVTNPVFDGYDYSSNPDWFIDTVNNAEPEAFSLFDLGSFAESSKGVKVPVNFTIVVAAESVAGYADYTLVVTGLHKGDSTDYINTVTKGTAVIDEIVSATVNTAEAAKTEYKDNEKFEIADASATVEVANGLTGEVKYSQNPGFFTAVPADSDKFSVDTTAVEIYLDGVKNCTPCTINGITVDHAWGEKYVSISNGSHAIVCEECGAVKPGTTCNHNFGEGVYNNDQTFVKDGTETCICEDCGASLTRGVEGTAGYVTKFANYKFLYIIFDYISLIFDIITGLNPVK